MLMITVNENWKLNRQNDQENELKEFFFNTSKS